ncbi:MAG: hypothetical protein EBT78_14280 [Betaproteobacteria bacterium]|nr:hypothetical protein [Betaproteobacteria bacterium]
MTLGTTTTACGRIILFIPTYGFSPSELIHVAASCSGALFALLMFQFIKERPVHITQIYDLATLAGIYALFNALFHDMAWANTDPNQLIAVSQLPIMVVGDFVGTIFGIFLFVRIANLTGLTKFAKNQTKKLIRTSFTARQVNT